MSCVTNVLVAVGMANWTEIDATPSGIAKMNAAMEAEFGQTLACLDDHFGGSKFPEISTWAAAFNYVPPSAVVAAAQAAGWLDDSQVQLMICDQEDDLFTVRTVAEWTESSAQEGGRG